MNISAIQHSNSTTMQCVLHNRDITLKIHTGKDIQSAQCIFGDPHAWVKTEDDYRWDYTSLPMSKVAETLTHFIFQVTITPKNYRLKYHFIRSEERRVGKEF